MKRICHVIAHWTCVATFATGLLGAQELKAKKVVITSPRDGVIVHPGESVRVVVSVSPAGSAAEVLLQVQHPLGVQGDLVKNAEPYAFMIAVPLNTVPERYGMTAVAGVPDAMVNGAQIVASSDPIGLLVERPDQPVRLEASLAPGYFENVGDTDDFLIYGYFADGEKVDLTRSSLTKYTSGAKSIVTVDSNGKATARGVGSTTIIVENGGARIAVRVDVAHPRARVTRKRVAGAPRR